MSEWIEYDGSDEQIESIKLHFAGIVWKDNHGFQLNTPLRSLIHHTPKDIKDFLDARCIKHILFCNRHPCADLIKIWADTGCPVYARCRVTGQSCALHTQRVDWNSDEWEFSLTPFETQ